MTVNVLGTAYTIRRVKESGTDKQLADALGYTDWTTKEIILDDSGDSVTLADRETLVKKVLRHEIIHAFFLESGLHECSGEVSCWAVNEAMVDWFARQGPKIYEAWKAADAL